MDLLTHAGVISTLTQIKRVEVNPSVLSRLLPLWRVLIWALAVFVLLVGAAVVRLDVQRLQMDFDRNDRMRHAAQITHERLGLELEVRRRLGAVQAYSNAASLVHVPTSVVGEGGT
jgi:Na+-transporting NADH:ubiquinone oxidoreductase subunit NqrC